MKDQNSELQDCPLNPSFRIYFVPSSFSKVGVSVLRDPGRSLAARKKVIMAIARQLAIDLWRLFTGRTTADNLGLIYLHDAA